MRKKNGFKEEADRLVGAVAERLARLSSCEGRIPSIEADLALEEIRRLYDFVLQMQRTELTEEMLKVDDMRLEPVEEEIPEPEDDMWLEPVEEEIPEPEDDMRMEPMEEEVPEPEDDMRHAPVKEELSQPVKDTPPERVEAPVAEHIEEVVLSQEVIKEKQRPVKEEAIEEALVSKKRVAPAHPVTEPTTDTTKSGNTILADVLKRDDQRSINDLVAAGRSDMSISKRMQHKSIGDLKSAIGINEKFIFVYELFGGNLNLYAETIERLNNMPGREEAIGLMETLRGDYRWDIENLAFQKLVDMVVRRYS